MAREKKRLPSPQGTKPAAALPSRKTCSGNISIFSLKRCAFQTIRPVVSREKRGFPLTLGRAACAAASHFTFFKTEMLMMADTKRQRRTRAVRRAFFVLYGKKGAFAKGGSSALKNRRNVKYEQNPAFRVSHCFLKGGCCHRWTNRIEERKLRRSPCREYVACFFTGNIPNRNALLRSGRERRGLRARHARKLIMAFAS